MRKLYAYAPDSRCPVQEFLQGMDEKIQDKLRFQLAYILDENSSFVEPYVKHFSLAKYRPFYEIRVIAAKTMVRVIFHEKTARSSCSTHSTSATARTPSARSKPRGGFMMRSPTETAASAANI